MDVPRGHGPWFVALLWNTAKSKKHTEIVLHTYPHLYTYHFNKKDANAFWVILMKIGPFEEWKSCVDFFNQWSQKTRNRMARIEKGIHMHQKLNETKGFVTLWVQTKDKATIRKEYDDYLKNREAKFLDNMAIYELKAIVSK
jgi:hypothetical protein